MERVAGRAAWMVAVLAVWSGAAAAQEPPGDIIYAARYYYAAPSKRTSHWHLYRIHADGTGRRQLTSGAGDQVGPEVSPDGRYVAYLSNPWKATEAFVVARADDGHVLFMRRRSARLRDGWCWVRWAADSRSLGIAEWADSADTPEKPSFVVAVPSGKQLSVRSWHPCRDPRVSPDGRHLAPDYTNAKGFDDLRLIMLDRAGNALSTVRMGDVLPKSHEPNDSASSGILQYVGGSTFLIGENLGHELASASRNWGLFTIDMKARKLVWFGEGCAMAVAADGEQFCRTTSTDLAPLGDGREVYASQLLVGRLSDQKTKAIVSGLVFVRHPQWVPRSGGK